MISEFVEEEGAAKVLAKTILELELAVKFELRKKQEEFMKKLQNMDQKMDDVIGALQAMKERNSTNVNANSSLPFRQHLAPRGGHMNRPPPNYTTTRFYNINTGPEQMERQRQPVEPVYYTNQSAGQEMTPKVDGFQSFQVQPQHHRFSEFSSATFNSNKPQFASFDPAKSPPEIPTTENMSAAVAELFNGHGVANGNPAGMAMTDDVNHSNKENKVMVTHESVEKRIIDLTVGYQQPYVDLSPAADRASNASPLEKSSLAQEFTRNKDLATEKMAKAKTPIVADELYGGINTETTFRFERRPLVKAQEKDLATEKMIKTKTSIVTDERYAGIDAGLIAAIKEMHPADAEQMYLASLEARKRVIPLPPISLPSSVTTTSTAIASKLVSTTTNLEEPKASMASTSSLFEVVENVEVTKVVVTSPPPLTPVTPASGKSEGSSAAMVGGFGKRRFRK